MHIAQLNHTYYYSKINHPKKENNEALFQISNPRFGYYKFALWYFCIYFSQKSKTKRR